MSYGFSEKSDNIDQDCLVAPRGFGTHFAPDPVRVGRSASGDVCLEPMGEPVASDPRLMLLSDCSGKRQVMRSEAAPECAPRITLLRHVRPVRPLSRE